MLFQFKHFFYLLGLFLLFKTSCAGEVSLDMCSADCPMKANEGCHIKCSNEYIACDKKCEDNLSDGTRTFEDCSDSCDWEMKSCARACPQVMNYDDCKLKCHS